MCECCEPQTWIHTSGWLIDCSSRHWPLIVNLSDAQFTLFHSHRHSHIHLFTLTFTYSKQPSFPFGRRGGWTLSFCSVIWRDIITGLFKWFWRIKSVNVTNHSPAWSTLCSMRIMSKDQFRFDVSESAHVLTDGGCDGWHPQERDEPDWSIMWVKGRFYFLCVGSCRTRQCSEGRPDNLNTTSATNCDTEHRLTDAIQRFTHAASLTLWLPNLNKSSSVRTLWCDNTLSLENLSFLCGRLVLQLVCKRLQTGENTHSLPAVAVHCRLL